MRRRSLLPWPALAIMGVTGVLVATETRHSPSVGRGDGDGSPEEASGSSSPTASADPAQWQEIEGRMMGHRVPVRVSPVARASERLTMLSLEPTRATDDAAVSEVAFTEDWPQEDVIKRHLLPGTGQRQAFEHPPARPRRSLPQPSRPPPRAPLARALRG